jgi:hypothetical protein
MNRSLPDIDGINDDVVQRFRDRPQIGGIMPPWQTSVLDLRAP